MATDVTGTTAIRLFSTDLDGTLLGNPAAYQRFHMTWSALPRERRPLLVYNTGRSISATLELVRTQELPEPDYIIGSVGTELHDPRSEPGPAFASRFGNAWNVAVADLIVRSLTPATKQAPANQNAFKSSWTWLRASRQEMVTLAARLTGAGLQARVEYSCRYFLDVLPSAAGKGNGLAWLCERLRIPLENVLVAGDTGNDTSMFLLPGVRGIVVGNALAELQTATAPFPVYHATAEMADGVIEGMRHFRLLTAPA